MTVKLKTMMPTEAHQKLRDELFSVLHKHSDMRTIEAIGVLSQLLGQVIAIAAVPGKLEELIEVINVNVKSGREAALLQLKEAQGRA